MASLPIIPCGEECCQRVSGPCAAREVTAVHRCTSQYCTSLHSTALHCIALYFTAQNCTAGAALYFTAQHCTAGAARVQQETRWKTGWLWCVAGVPLLAGHTAGNSGRCPLTSPLHTPISPGDHITALSWASVRCLSSITRPSQGPEPLQNLNHDKA